MLRRVMAIALGDLRLTLKERSALFWMLVMPIAFIALFGTFMGRSGAARLTGLAVADEDGSFLSQDFMETLRGEGFSLRMVAPGAPDTAGERTRTLVIPRGFADSLAARRQVALRYEARGGSGAERDMAAEVHIQKAVVRTLALLAEIDTAASDAPLPMGEPSFQETYRRMRERPDLVRTVVTTAGRGRAVPQGFAASAPAMLVLFVLINTVIYGAVLLTLEKQSRCLARLAGQPVRRVELLGGKLLGRLLTALLQSFILVLAGRLLFGVYWGPSPLGLCALLVCLGLACGALGILLGAVLRSPEQASAVGWIIPLFLAAIGGCWWPLEIVPPWMRAVGHVSPAAWAMDALHGLVSFGRGGEVVVVPCLVLLGFAAVLLSIGARALRTD